MCGITLSYAIGRGLGPTAVARFGRWLHINANDLARVERWLERSGKWMLTFGYFVPGVRHLTAIVAGSSQLPVRVFATYAYSGAALWSLSFITLGWWVGRHWESALHAVQRHILIAALALAAAAALYGLDSFSPTPTAFLLVRRTMTVSGYRHTVTTRGQGDIQDITPIVSRAVAASALSDGIATVFVVGSTAGLTTIEFEPGAVADFNRLFDELAPRDAPYAHHKRWGDDNGSSHVRAALLGPSVVVPFSDGAARARHVAADRSGGIRHARSDA